MKLSLLILGAIVTVAACTKEDQTSVPQTFDTAYHKVLGPEANTETLAAQLFAVLQRFAHTPQGASLEPYFKRGVDTKIGLESLSITNHEEGIKCDKITSLAGIVYLCEFALNKEGIGFDTDETSIAAILYKALENVRGSSPKAIMDSRNSIACRKDAHHGYGCELSLPDAANKGDVPSTPQMPQHEPTPSPHEIPVFQ